MGDVGVVGMTLLGMLGVGERRGGGCDGLEVMKWLN